MASEAGALEFRGVSLRLPDGSSTQVLLPQLTDTEREVKDKRRSRVLVNEDKTKNKGMDARWSISSLSGAVSHSSKSRWLQCQVVEEQPLVWIKKSNLTHGTVMLYDGER